jgi:hypothetical protein
MGHGPYSSFEARKSAHLRMTRDCVNAPNVIMSYTPKYACLIVSVDIISSDVPDARMVPASSR